MKRLRDIGYAVQSAVAECLVTYHLKPELIDRGFDYEVTLEDGAMRFEVGSYLFEIKATTSGEVRLTPTQASTASTEAHRYVLCVVDLRTVPPDRLTQPWTACDIEQLSKLVGDIGNRTKDTCELVTSARSNEVGIRNDQALRYGVPVKVWETGCSIREWVGRVMPPQTADAS